MSDHSNVSPFPGVPGRPTAAEAAQMAQALPEHLPSFPLLATKIDHYATRLPWWSVLVVGLGVGWVVWGRK